MAKSKVTAITAGAVVLPVDVDRCQVEIIEQPSARTMLRFGPGPSPERCASKPTWILCASGGMMSVCDRHKAMADTQLAAEFTAQPIVRG